MSLLSKKFLVIAGVTTISLVNIFIFQNCSDTSFLKGQSQGSSSQASTGAIVTDNNNIVATVGPADSSVSTKNTSECSQLANHYQSKIDISKLKGDTIQSFSGANFIYSSRSTDHYPSVVIDNLNGKTLVCGLTIDKIIVKKGRLDLIMTVVNELINSSGVVNLDESSKILK